MNREHLASRSRTTRSRMEWKGREGKGRDHYLRRAHSKKPNGSPPAPKVYDLRIPDLPALLTFECFGKVKSWSLTQAHVDEWHAAYPALDILAEARKALAWIGAAPDRRKTARGMPRFLVGWLNRATDRPHSNGGNGAQAQAAIPNTVPAKPRTKWEIAGCSQDTLEQLVEMRDAHPERLLPWMQDTLKRAGEWRQP
jgi:hypothetical protein